ncbi:hypothetical protein VNI00_016886 [Paramarasmius palmivorus]|uniref:Thioredoxin domain-containing protein n=1 Tax=Paramarasmius palmivorus TaxID=297713 RepID=A0AAW0B9W8_9AGAR
MLSLQLIALVLAITPSLVSAGIFTKDSKVTMLDPKSFKKAMKANETSMVAFVAPWCGHCQRMSPEYSKAAKGAYPLIPFYAVDCDDDKNKPLCAEQGVQGFPTVKLFPRGKELAPMVYQGERTANAMFKFASLRVPNTNAKLGELSDIESWVEKTAKSDKPRALLLTKDKKVPLLWKVLGNKFRDQIELGTHRDIGGKTSVALGFEAGEEKESKVLVYPAGATKPARYEGKNKLEALTKFFKSVLDGTAELNVVEDEKKAQKKTTSEEASPEQVVLESRDEESSSPADGEHPKDEL